MQVYINKIELHTPGMKCWSEAIPFLKGDDKYSPQDFSKLTLNILQANERRRTTQYIKLALKVAQDIMGDQLEAASEYSTVFSSSDGDHEIIQRVCTALTLAERPVSPTIFHNSVHNAPAGYWAIAAKSMQESTSLCAGNESFVAGLIEVSTMVGAENKPSLFVCYDFPPPEPLAQARRMTDAFAVAFLLSHEKSARSIASLDLALVDSDEVSSCSQNSLESLRQGNPAARSLPLLEFLAKGVSGKLMFLSTQNKRLKVVVNPC